jgi:hypothetical protein
MRRRLSLGLPINLYEDLRDEAEKHQVSIADIIRQKIIRRDHSIPDQPQKPDPIVQTPKQDDELKAICLEMLFLLREFLFERNAQILKKVDEKLERRFGKDRKKFL